jgi:hypothetical protein
MTLPTKAKDLARRLRKQAGYAAQGMTLLAEAKTVRNRAAGDADSSYASVTPEQTLEWQAAAVIAEMGEALATQTRLAEGNFAAREEAVQRARDRAEALEAAERRLAAIHDRAMSICEQYHADIDQPAARHAYALALHDIAALSTPQPASEGKKS